MEGTAPLPARPGRAGADDRGATALPGDGRPAAGALEEDASGSASRSAGNRLDDERGRACGGDRAGARLGRPAGRGEVARRRPAAVSRARRDSLLSGSGGRGRAAELADPGRPRPLGNRMRSRRARPAPTRSPSLPTGSGGARGRVTARRRQRRRPGSTATRSRRPCARCRGLGLAIRRPGRDASPVPEVDLDGAVPHPQRIGAQPAAGRRSEGRAVGDAELRPVPEAGHHAVLVGALESGVRRRGCSSRRRRAGRRSR